MPDPEPTSPAPAAAWPRARHLATASGLLLLYLLMATYGLSKLPLMDPDEPRYAAAGREMAEGGSWLIPTFNGEPRYNKPPLFYWLVALSAKLGGGSSEATARLPSVIMGLAMLALTVWLGVRLYGAVAGYLAGLILATSPLFLALSRACVIDQTFSTLVAAGIACSLLAFAGLWPFRRGTAVLAAGALMGLAFMAKGPASALVALTPLLFWLVFARPVASAAGTTRAGSPHPRMADSLGPGSSLGAALLIVLALAAWWYVALWAQIGTARFAELVRFEMLGRLAGEVHREPFYYYLYVFPLVTFPWSLALLSALAVAWRPLRGEWPVRPTDSRPSAESLRAVADPFLVAWVLAVLLFFSIPKAKLGSYMLPALPAAALLTARFLTRLRSAEEPLRRVWVSLPAVLAGAVAAALALVPFSVERLPQDAQDALAAPLPTWAIAGILILFLCVPWIWSCAARDARPAVVAVSVFMLAVLLFVLPVAAEKMVYKSTSRDLARDPAVQARLANAERVYTSGWEEEGLAYYLHRPVHEIGAKEEKKEEPPRDTFAKALASAPSGRVLIFAHKGKTLKWFIGQAPERRLLGERPFVEVARACGAELPRPLRVIAENRYVAVLVNEP